MCYFAAAETENYLPVILPCYLLSQTVRIRSEDIENKGLFPGRIGRNRVLRALFSLLRG